MKLWSCSFTAEIGHSTLGLQGIVRARIRSELVKAILVQLDKNLQAGQACSGIHISIPPTPSNKRLGLKGLFLVLLLPECLKVKQRSKELPDGLEINGNA